MKTVLALLLLTLPVGLALSACATTEKDIVEDQLVLCADCGQVMGTPMCCDPTAEKCPGCGLVKGSPGCCKIEKGGEDVLLCPDCGMIKGSEECCSAVAERCDHCGMIKGSPGCCK